MAADNHLIQLAEPGLWGPDRSHWPTYDKSIATVHHIGLNGLHIVADHRVYRSSYSSSEVALILAASTTTLWMGRLKRIQSILLLPQQAAINLDVALSSLHCQRERFTTAGMPPPFSSLSSLPLFSHLSLALSLSSSPFLYRPFLLTTFPLFFLKKKGIFSPSTPQCHRGSSTRHSLVVTEGHTLTQQRTSFN